MEEGGDKTVPPRLFDNPVHEFLYAPVQIEITVNERLRFLAADVELLGQAKGAHAVNNAEIDAFCHPPHLGGDEGRMHSEYLRRRVAVHILACLERLDQRLVPGIMGEDPQIDLRIIGGQQDMAGRGDECLPDPLSFPAAHGNVLQIRIAAAQAAGGGHRLVEGGVDATGGRVDQGGELIDVG